MATPKKTKKRKKTVPKRPALRDLFRSKWRFFNYELTPAKDLKWLLNLLHNHVSCTVPAPCSLGQVLTAICEQAQIPIPMNLLSLELRAPVLSRSKTIFRYAWDAIDGIARNYEERNMQWWVSEGRLTMDIIKPFPKPVEFYRIAGALQWEMRAKFPEQRRWTMDQYLKIAAQLDEFDLSKLLSEPNREKLAVLNQKSGKPAVRTVAQGIASKSPPWLHRETMRVLYHAFERFKVNIAY
jgi:hypothetical protein